MAFGFGSTEGSGAGDRVVTSFTAHATQRSYGVWVYPSSGGDSIKRIFEKRVSSNQVELVIYNTVQTRIEYERQWSLQRGRWSVPSFTGNVWTHLGISYDSESTGNDAEIYVNGASQSVTTLDVPSGSAMNNGDPYVIGNRGDGTRTIGARLAEFAIWDRVLSPSEWLALGSGVSPLYFARELRCYVPLIRDAVDILNGNCSTIGTQPRRHLPTLFPQSIQAG